MVAPQIVSVVGSMPVVPTCPSPLQNVQTQILHQVVLAPGVATAPPPIHSFTTNQIQLQAVSSLGFPSETPRPVPPVTSPLQSRICVETPPPCPPPPRPVSPPLQLAAIQTPLPMAPQNIPPPSPIQVQNIPPPPLPPKKSEDTQPKIHIGNISLSFKKKKEAETAGVGNGSDVGEIPTPPTATTSVFDANYSDRKRKRKKRKTEQMSVSGCSPPPPGYFEGIPFPDTIPVPDAAQELPKQMARGKSNIALTLTWTFILFSSPLQRYCYY